MKLNDSQFRAPHTGILYTPPKWPDIDEITTFKDMLVGFGPKISLQIRVSDF